MLIDVVTHFLDGISLPRTSFLRGKLWCHWQHGIAFVVQTRDHPRKRGFQFFFIHRFLDVVTDTLLNGLPGIGEIIWASAESQEMAPTSPDMHEEFLMQYERRVLEPFGLNGYGCCEDLTRKLDNVFRIPHLRRISISPWAQVAACAEKLGNRYIYSRKPQPSHLVGDFDGEVIRREIRETVEAARRNRCVLEMILKDTHTCQHRPERFTEWTRIAREEIDRAYGG